MLKLLRHDDLGTWRNCGHPNLQRHSRSTVLDAVGVVAPLMTPLVTTLLTQLVELLALWRH